MPNQQYSGIFIIYNPNSTSGRAETKANRLAARLKRRSMSDINVQATKHAGHAEELAYQAAKKHDNPLIISVSGDGGYNEVVNGAFRAQTENPKHHPVCAILAAGNANDHRRTVRRRPLSWAIVHAPPEPIDILRLTIHKGKRETIRYAHSYIGFGATSEGAAGLNEEKLTTWKEIKIILVTMIINFEALRIVLPDGTAQKLDSLIFANINQMAKVVKLGPRTNLHDGLFRVVALPHRRNPFRRVLTLVGIATVGFRNPPQKAAFEFKVPGNELAHLDGEVIHVAGGSNIRVEAVHEALLTIR